VELWDAVVRAFEPWSWGLSILGITTQILAGRAPRWAWIVGFWSQVPWCVYAVVTKQWGFLPSSISYAAVYAFHWRTVRRERAVMQEPVPIAA